MYITYIPTTCTLVLTGCSFMTCVWVWCCWCWWLFGDVNDFRRTYMYM